MSSEKQKSDLSKVKLYSGKPLPPINPDEEGLPYHIQMQVEEILAIRESNNEEDKESLLLDLSRTKTELQEFLKGL